MNRTENNDMELTRQKWVNEGGIYFPISGDTVLLKTPGKGVFNVVKSQNPMDARLGLQRIGDAFEFSNLMPKAVKDYLDDNLLPQYADQRKKILEQVDLLEISTIDILKALIDEVNIHGCLPESQCLNIPTAKHAFEILEFYYISELDKHKEVKAFIDKHMKEDEATTISEWLHKPQKTNKKKTNEDLLEDKFDSVYIATLNSHSPSLGRETSTSRGIIETEPNTDGYFLMRDRYEDSAHLCLLLRKKDSPSLYRGMLV